MNDKLVVSLLSFMVIIPAAILCFFPMRNQLRFRIRFSVISMVLALISIILSVSALDAYKSYSYEQLMLPLLVVCLTVFYLLVKVPFSKALCIFLVVIALISFISNIANGYDAIIHPDGSINDFSIEAAIFQFGLNTLAVTILAYPFYRYGSWLVDNVNIKNVWHYASLASILFVILNIVVFPTEYSLFQDRQVFLFYWGTLATMLPLYLLLMVLSYQIIRTIYDKAKTDERNKLLEMEENQFIKQQKYMNETSQARHDFKHVVRTLTEFVDAKDYESAEKFLKSYADSLPVNEILKFSDNTAVNATMNYYAQTADQNGIKTDLIAVVPDTVPLTDNELCSIVGNILENAITACMDIPEKDRFIQFMAEPMNDTQFLIVATNSFSGKVKKHQDRYLSTKRHSSGIGLSSIQRTVQAHGGTAEFSNSDTEFYTNIIIPMSGDKSDA